MFFLISFAWLVAASFAFVIAILSPNWLAFMPQNSNSTTPVQRGVFWECDLLSSNGTYSTTQCVSIIQQGSSTNTSKWLYQFAIASAAIAIACAALSLIAIWLFGIYFQVRKRTKKTICFLVCLILLVLLIFCTSFVVWVLLISETTLLASSINRNMFNWPMWLAVGASGGYFMTFLTLLLSCCAICRRKIKRSANNYPPPRNQF